MRLAYLAIAVTTIAAFILGDLVVTVIRKVLGV